MEIHAKVGAVVPFRAKKLVVKESDNLKYPLLWMENLEIDSFSIKWPIENRKEQYILDDKESNKRLVPIENYVMIRRFSSKEQNKRIICSVLLKDNFPSIDKIGIENHILFLSGLNKNLEKNLAYGIVGYLSMKIFDVYFRTLNGNTQVNKYELINFPFPNKIKLCKIGEYVINNNIKKIDKLIEEQFYQIIGIDIQFLEMLYD